MHGLPLTQYDVSQPWNIHEAEAQTLVLVDRFELPLIDWIQANAQQNLHVYAWAPGQIGVPRKSGPCFELGLAPQTRGRTIAKRAKPEEIISKLREVEVQLSQGESVAWRRSRSKTLISQAVYSRASHVSTATMSSRASPNSISPSPRSTQAPCNGVETVVAGANAGGVGSRDRCKTIDIIDMAVTALCRVGRSGAIAVGCRFVRGCGGRER